MSGTDNTSLLKQEQARDLKIDLIAWLAVALVTIGFLIVDVISEVTDGAVAGEPDRWRTLLLMDGSSILVLMAIMPLVLWFTHRFPLSLQNWKTMLPLYLGASVIWSIIHVIGMVAIRLVLYPMMFGGDYSFERANGILGEWIYEYRKDLWTFALYIWVIYTARRMGELQREVRAAKAEARRTSRVTLKCGGTTLFIDAASIDWARAAGNYVEISAGGKVHLARITLTGLLDQVQAANSDIVRTHRSWLVNQARISEVRPTGDGDQTALLASGAEVPVSRRYRENLAAV